MIPLRRNVSKIEVAENTIEKLPEKIKEIMEVLGSEEHLLIKGGLAKAVFSEILKERGRIQENKVWTANSDLDIIVSIPGGSWSNKKTIASLCERVDGLTEKMKDIIPLKGEDVEIIKGNLKDGKILRRILETRDLTINEVVLIFEDGKWHIHHTEKCFRDTVLSVGTIAFNGKGTGWYDSDSGRWIATPYGIMKLLDTFVKGKTKHIYLPQDWLIKNSKEVERLAGIKREAKKDPIDCLGSYGAILAHKYREKPAWLQKRLMKVLKRLNITDAKNLGEYFLEQTRLFEALNGKPFEFKERSFEEVYKSRVRKNQERIDRKDRRAAVRKKCKHQKEKTECGQCNWNCKIIKCEKCTMIKVIPEHCVGWIKLDQLACNCIFINADVLEDIFSLFPRMVKVKYEIPTNKTNLPKIKTKC